MQTRIELEQRLIRFAVDIIRITENLPATRVGSHLADQIVRSGTSCALNYGEAQSAESRRDFIHKLGIVLKELRETQIGLKIIEQARILPVKIPVAALVHECDELIAIFYRSVQTAKSPHPAKDG
jgi:four helix bundle protein